MVARLEDQRIAEYVALRSVSRQRVIAAATISSSFTLWLLSELPALAEQKDFSQGGGFAKESYYVTLGLFLLSLPGTPSPGKTSAFAVLLVRSAVLLHATGQY